MHGVQPRMVAVSARPRIGRLEVVRRDFREGASLADMAAGIAADMPAEFWAMGVALLDDCDDDPLPPQYWAMVRPKAGHCVRFVIMPGKGGDTLQIFGSIAIIAAQAFAYSIPGIGPLLAAGIGLAGGAALGMLAPKPKQSVAKAPKQLGEAGFSDNVLAPYEQVPTVLGVRRVPAALLAPPIVEIEDNNSYGKAIIALAGRHEIGIPLIAGTPPEFLAENIREGDASDLDPTIYTSVQWQDAGRELSRHNTEMNITSDQRSILAHSPSAANVALYDLPKAQYFRLGRRRFPDRIVIDLLFDQGFYRLDTLEKAGVALELAFVKAGSTTVYLPQIHARGNFHTPIRAKLIIEFAPDPGGLTAPSASSMWRQAFASTTSQTTYGGTAHSYYGASAAAAHVGVIDPNICTIYCDPASIALDGSWQLSLKVGAGYISARMNYTNGAYDWHGAGDIPSAWFGSIAGGGIIYAMEDQAKMQSHVILEQFTRAYDTEAVDASGLATYEIQTRNQRVEQISFMAGRYVDKRWTSTAWVAEPHVSSNPGEIAYDVLTNAAPALLARPLAAGLVDGTELGEWADWCTEQGLTCNAYIDQGTLEDVLPIIFQAGHAYLKRSRKWGVYIERSRLTETPVMVFSPRNSRGFRVEKSFEHKPHALRVTFDDEDDDFQTHPGLVVYAEGYDETNATLFESAHYRGITQEWQAVLRATRDLAIIWQRDRTYALETDARYLVAGRGDLVGVNHFVLNEAHGFAAIREVIRQEVGGVTKITGLRLDTDLDMQAGTTGIAISTNAGAVVAAQSGQGGKTRDLVFTIPLADDAEIEAGCTITSGTLASRFLYCIIDDVLPGAGGTAKLMLVDEKPEIFGLTRSDNDLYASPDLYAEADLYNLDN